MTAPAQTSRPASSSDEPWETRAACRDADPEIFFPERTGLGPADVRAVLPLCSTCPVIRECYRLGAELGGGGIWGGHHFTARGTRTPVSIHVIARRRPGHGGAR